MTSLRRCRVVCIQKDEVLKQGQQKQTLLSKWAWLRASWLERTAICASVKLTRGFLSRRYAPGTVAKILGIGWKHSRDEIHVALGVKKQIKKGRPFFVFFTYSRMHWLQTYEDTAFTSTHMDALKGSALKYVYTHYSYVSSTFELLVLELSWI